MQPNLTDGPHCLDHTAHLLTNAKIDGKPQISTTFMITIQCSLDYTEKYYLDYTENKAHSLGVRKTIRVLSGKLSKPA